MDNLYTILVASTLVGVRVVGASGITSSEGAWERYLEHHQTQWFRDVSLTLEHFVGNEEVASVDRISRVGLQMEYTGVGKAYHVALVWENEAQEFSEAHHRFDGSDAFYFAESPPSAVFVSSGPSRSARTACPEYFNSMFAAVDVDMLLAKKIPGSWDAARQILRVNSKSEEVAARAYSEVLFETDESGRVRVGRVEHFLDGRPYDRYELSGWGEVEGDVNGDYPSQSTWTRYDQQTGELIQQNHLYVDRIDELDEEAVLPPLPDLSGRAVVDQRFSPTSLYTWGEGASLPLDSLVEGEAEEVGARESFGLSSESSGPWDNLRPSPASSENQENEQSTFEWIAHAGGFMIAGLVLFAASSVYILRRFWTIKTSRKDQGRF